MESGGGLIDHSAIKADVGCTDEVVKAVEAGNGVELKAEVASGVTVSTSIAPITPIKEVREVRAPRPSVKCRLDKIDVNNSEESECGSPCTPKQSVFDPFAPGPDGMCLAPKIKTKTCESRISVSRQLEFGSSNLGDSSDISSKMCSDDEKLLELVCVDILDVIVPSSTEIDESEKLAHNAESDGFKTPPLIPCFNMIGNKCPDAPMKQGEIVSRRLHIDPSLCRKLEF